MTTYRYNCLSKDGAKVTGVIKAYDEFDAVTQLRESFSVVTSIEEVQETEKTGMKKRIKDKSLAVLCSQFGIILASGMPIVRCVEMVAAQSKDRSVKALLTKVAEDVDNGYGLAQSFEKNGPYLPPIFLTTIRAGEESGTLELCFQQLESYFTSTSQTKAKVVSALVYPAIVIAVAIIVFIIIMVVAVPRFTEVFASLGTELPGITRGLIAVSNFFVKFWWLVILLILLCILVPIALNRTEGGKLRLSELRLKRLPLHGLQSMNCAAQFASNLATVLTAGLPITEALSVVADSVSNYYFGTAVHSVTSKVEMGRGVADAMKEDDTFPEMLSEMVGVGEESGTMEQTLRVISDYYNNEVNTTTTRLISMLEPALTIGLAVITVILLLAVYLPMFGMFGSI